MATLNTNGADLKTSCDRIVCGSGSVLAPRLMEDPDNNVLKHQISPTNVEIIKTLYDALARQDIPAFFNPHRRSIR